MDGRSSQVRVVGEKLWADKDLGVGGFFLIDAGLAAEPGGGTPLIACA
jgi:hypothetical protein